MRQTILTKCIYALVSLFWFLCAGLLLLPDSRAVAQTNARAWGQNNRGQLGDGTTIDRSLPISPLGTHTFLAISGGDFHTIALKAEGTVWAWGRNSVGQLGDGTTTNRTMPGLVPGLNSIIAIAAGGASSLALKSDGTVWAWGSNSAGQLGDGTTLHRYSPVQIMGLNNVVAITARGEVSTALKVDGTIWAWGSNGQGQLGDGTNTERHTPVRVIGENGIGYLSNVIALAQGGEASIALRADGTLWGWGRGALGIYQDQVITKPVRINSLEQIKAIAASSSGEHVMALKSDGTVWTWGFNGQGQLGIGTSDAEGHPIPVQVSNLANVIALAAGSGQDMALKADGTVWTWGDNSIGQLGDGTTTDRYTPIQVTGVSQATSISAGRGSSFVAIASTRTISGTITLEDIASSSPAQALTFLFRPKDARLAFTRLMPVGPSGTFQVRNLPPGDYDVAIKGHKWLQTVLPVNITNTNITNMSVSLLGGDANNDNSIDVFDLADLITAFDATPDAPNWDEGKADFNCDGSVDVFDLDLLIRNFDAQGDE